MARQAANEDVAAAPEAPPLASTVNAHRPILLFRALWVNESDGRSFSEAYASEGWSADRKAGKPYV